MNIPRGDTPPLAFFIIPFVSSLLVGILSFLFGIDRAKWERKEVQRELKHLAEIERAREEKTMRDKQIEDMCKIVCNCYNNTICEIDLYPCNFDCSEAKAMERLYNAGYRKSNEVAGEIIEEIEEGIKAAVSALQFENNPIHRQVKHETYSSLMRFVKTFIEKKYGG